VTARGSGPSRRRRDRVAWRLALGVAMVVLASPAAAGSWGGLTPGESGRADVERIFGRPSRERTMVEEGRAVAEWTYAAERAPQAMERMVVSFGFLVGGRFAPDIVRAVTLYPKPRLFPLSTITTGWGTPEAIGTEEATGRPSFHYRSQGLLIILDKTGSWAEFLLFGPRQAGGS
jgi:hypothetical protein